MTYPSLCARAGCPNKGTAITIPCPVCEMPPSPPIGWICPVCRKGCAPHADKCGHCAEGWGGLTQEGTPSSAYPGLPGDEILTKPPNT